MTIKDAAKITLEIFVGFGIIVGVMAFISWIGTFSSIAAIILTIITLFVIVTSLIYIVASWWVD